MNNKNWKEINRKKEYENRLFTVEKVILLRPDKTEGTFFILKRKSHFSIIIPLNEKGETYLVGQYRMSVKRYSWEFPMGSVVRKSPLVMAKQELKEETGLIAKQWKKLGAFAVAPGHSSQWAYVFLAENLQQKEKEPEPDEFLEIKKIPIKDVGKMIKEGVIFDGPTIAAYNLFQGSGQ